MKILLINDFKIGGGAEVIFLKTCDILRELGHTVDIVFHDEKITSSSSVFSYLFSYGEYRKMFKRLIAGSYDVVYVLNYAYAFSPSILLAIRKYKKLNKNVRVIYNAHDFHIICPNSGFTYFRKNEINCYTDAPTVRRFLFQTLDHRGHIYSILKKIQWIWAYRILALQNVFDTILCPSNFLVAHIKKVYPHKNVYLLRNPLEMENKSTLKNHKVETNAPLKLVYFGRLSSEKGLSILIDGLSRVKVDYELHLYGDGPEKEMLDSMIEKLEVQDKIKLMGKLPWLDLMNVLPSYDIFVLPSVLYENAPLSIVEAAASGLFIMTMGYGGMQEMARIVGNYNFINPISPKSLEHAFMNIRKMSFVSPDLSPFSVATFKNSLCNYLK